MTLSDAGVYKCFNKVTVNLAIIGEPVCKPETAELTENQMAFFSCWVVAAGGIRPSLVWKVRRIYETMGERM